MSNNISELAKLIRYDILTSTTAAGSGHPSSSLSGVELMAELWFGGTLRMDLKDPKAITNDRVIFSKGHAAPLLYSMYQAAGYVSHEQLNTLRTFNSVLEGHPTPRFEPIEVSTGSLGQGLSVGLGMALGFQKTFKGIEGRIPHVFVVMGDSELAEGQIWEAVQLAAHYQAHNLVGIVDVNRLGQRGETMDGWNVKEIGARFTAFGWNTIVLEDGHDLESVRTAFQMIEDARDGMPFMIVAKTKKGAGISLLEDLDGWHGKPLPADKLDEALAELGEVDTTLVGKIALPAITLPKDTEAQVEKGMVFEKGQTVATREAYGAAIEALGGADTDVVVLDAETSNSTFAEVFKKSFPDRFFEMYIAEQNMVSVALGLSKLGYFPFVSSFAAFFTRAFDQIRMIQYAEGNVKIVGSHAGVSIGQDGSSQMGLEDLAMMRSLLDSVVVYPSDAVSTAHLVVGLHRTPGIGYLRLTREKTPVLYDMEEAFPIGGSKVLRESDNDKAVIIGAGITLHEALKAYDSLKAKGTEVAVVDAYSVKPLDEATVIRLAEKVGHIVVVEDHYPYGGLGEAVKAALYGVDVKVTHLCVTKNPRSGSPQELLAYEEIDAAAIEKAVLAK
jgi:transketolase